MLADQITNEYFDWMVDLVNADRGTKETSYIKLLTYLHNTEFTYLIPRDRNRAEDGVDLRYRFGLIRRHPEYSECLRGPSSVLEMMIALAIRCEESIMDDPAYGDRTSQWFWGMIVSLGLGGMTDAIFDRDHVEECVTRFLNREYERNGKGGLFTVKGTRRDMRKMEIWYQLNAYLNGIA